ncbi:uncharacterized protein LOC135681616 isoform X2 [Rhopilema esculentum]|uniref:uncharacterized protein LOC135681616 isoform X2 n=1 Tax=Rhopilema esculentum TaxID=499914 RepID=UPI0031D7D6E9
MYKLCSCLLLFASCQITQVSCWLQVDELTPTIFAVLQAVHKTKDRDKGSLECKACEKDLDSLLMQALAPITTPKEMQTASLPRNFSVTKATTTQTYSFEWPRLGESAKSYSKAIDAENLVAFNSQLSESEIKTSCDAIEESPSDATSSSSAASFFMRAAQRLSLSSKRRQRKSRRKGRDSDACSTSTQEQCCFATNFSDLIMRCPPQAPPSLFKQTVKKCGETNGKIKVILNVSEFDETSSTSCIKFDPKKKQASLIDRRTESYGMSPRLGREAKLYPFDAMFDSNSSKPEICCSSLVDLLHTVVNHGDDAAVLAYGHPNLGKSTTMIGSDENAESMGVIPCAISWLYQLIEDKKERTGARFSVRVSAVEIVGKSENLKDLLLEQDTGSMNNCSTSPSLYLQRERTGPVQFADFTELRAPSAEKASFYFDAAITARTKPAHEQTDPDPAEDPSERQNSNMIFTFHVYQYMIDKVGTGEVHGGRSRFHLIDLSGCKRNKKHREPGDSWLSLSSLGNVLVALANGAKHVPHRDNKLTVLLKEAIGALSTRIALLTFVSGDPKKYPATLSTMEVTTRIHRSRRKKSRYSSGSSGGDSSCDESRRLRRRTKPVQPLLVTQACESESIGDSEFTTSAAEESCDTVIYVGPKGEVLSDRELTDFEGPPDFDDAPTFHESENFDVASFVEPTRTLDLSCEAISTIERPKFTPEIVERHCSCNLEKSTSSNTCIHGTSMKNVDTNFLSNNSLLSSFSEERGRLSSRKSSQSTVKDVLGSYTISDNAREALLHPSTPYYCLVPGSHKSNLNVSIEAASSERNLHSTDNGRSFSKKLSSSQERIRQTSERGRSRTRNLPTSIPVSRTTSLDRYFSRNEDGPCKSAIDVSAFSPRIRSEESIASSQQTVDNFERDLVSKIVERFDVENEISEVEPELISKYLENERLATAEEERRSKKLEEALKRLSVDDSIIVTVTSQERLDPLYIDSLNVRELLRKQREASIAEFQKTSSSITEEKSTQEVDEQFDLLLSKTWEPLNDLTKSTSSQKDKEEGQAQGGTRLDSGSSCGSLLTIPKTAGLASEGVSSGYESMRCESSNNLNAVSDMDSERGKAKSTKKDKKAKDKKNKDTPSIPESGIFNIEDQFDRSRFGKSKVHKKEVKKLIGERKGMKESLQQVLQKLVLLKDPSPDVDERLRDISLDDPQAVRTLTRENRILQRKVDVCKSHLQLVTCFDANPHSVVTTAFLYKTTAV